MCNCPAHRKLVDCTCQCDHTRDRLEQWQRRAISAELQLRELAERGNGEFFDVGLFHARFGLDNVIENGVGPRAVDDDLIKFRIEFMKEELNEFTEGWDARLNDGRSDHAKMADALVDLVYVAMGTAHLLGYPWYRVWREVQRANLAKERARPDGSDSKRGSAFDVVKPAGWQAPDVAGVLGAFGWPID